jgi:hypothetical protein
VSPSANTMHIGVVMLLVCLDLVFVVLLMLLIV